MKPLKTLVVDDDDGYWYDDFQEDFLRVYHETLHSIGYSQPEIVRARNQTAANELLNASPAPVFHLILLDLNYPVLDEPLPHADQIETAGEEIFQGMKWLPTLRELQPNATIIILTSHGDFKYAIRAVCELHANDFVSKTTPIHDIAARVGVALKNAEYRFQLYQAEQQNQRLENELNALLRSRTTRTYAEDTGRLMTRVGSRLHRVAERLVSGDPSEMTWAAREIRGQIEALPKEFNELTRRTIQDDDDKLENTDVVALVEQLSKLYLRRFASLKARIEVQAELQPVWVETYPGDLKVSLHEIISNSLDALEESKPDGGGQLMIRIEDRLVTANSPNQPATSRSVSIHFEDNGQGFDAAKLPHEVFSPEYSTKEKKPNRGLGLYIAQRMLHHSGGDIVAANRPAGGAIVSLSFDIW